MYGTSPSHKYIKSINGELPNQHADNICIFSHYDANNDIASYVLNYLDSIKSVNCDIVFVSTSNELSNIDVINLLKYCKVVIIRDNIGYDFGSYKCGIDFIKSLDKYKKLILANDSVYGPFYELSPLIIFGEKNNLDIWGATDSCEISYHIQSYFLIYSNSVLISPSFKQFWDNVVYLNDDTPNFKTKIIEDYEIGGSSHFISHGFKLGALCDCNKVIDYIKNDFIPLINNHNSHPHLQGDINNTYNPTHFYWDILIKKFKYPFIKRELLTINPLNININEWPSLIQKISSFHYDLISTHLNSLSKSSHIEEFKWFFADTQTEAGIPIPYFLTQLQLIWPDLDKTMGINFNTENGVLNAITWWENPGRQNSPDIHWPQDNIFPQAIHQRDDSIQQDSLFDISQGAMSVLRIRADLNYIKIDTASGRNQFILWQLSQGSKEYRFLRLTEKELSSLLSPNMDFGGKLKHLPKISRLLTCIAENNEGIYNALLKGDLKTYDAIWSQSKDYLLQLISDNVILSKEPTNSENRFSIARPFGSLSPSGINTIGFPKAYFGIAEDVRTATQSLLHAHIPTAVCSVPLPLPTTKTRPSPDWIDSLLRQEPTYKVNLINLPAADSYHLLLKGWSGLFSNRYNIGAWQWELPHWPNKWLPLLNMLDEIWAISRFTETLFKKYTNKPVLYMPLAIEKPLFNPLPRKSFNLPNNAFIFLSVFDGNSWIARKNPIAAVRAFSLAFPKKITDSRLIVKVMNSNPRKKEFIELIELANKDNRIIIIDETLSRNDMLALINCCDVFVSLHRSEGFGRVIAESMLLGKPVISTNYSGSLDFAHEETAFIVDGPLISLQEGDYVEHEGQHWMEPDINIAAEKYKYCYENPKQIALVAKRGQSYIEEHHSIKACSDRYLARLREIGKINNI